MKESATQSMPASSAASRSERSFSASAENGMVVSGRLTPLRSESLPPTSTRVTMRLGSASVTVSSHLAVIDQQRVAGLDRGENFRMRQVDALGIARRRVGVEHEGVAVFHRRGAAGECAEAQLRPLQIDQDADRPARVASRRCGSWPTSSRMRSWLVWLILMRNTSAPASNSLAIMSALDEAGPRVATILARRRRLIACRLRAGAAADSVVGGRDGARAARAAAMAGSGACSAVSVSCTVQERCSLVSTSKKPVRS